KTLMVSSIAQILDVHFKRIQFTPDLMPSDITGTTVLDETPEGKRQFRFVQGPIFSNIVLADEINRTPPKTQAALLQAMQEREVSIGNDTHKLPEPFFVIATQNPIEQEGTYPLPEAQLDRFLFDIRVGYPSATDEVAILRATTSAASAPIAPVIHGAEIREVQRRVREVIAPDPALAYAAALVRATRPDGSASARVRQYVRWGAGPRAGQALILGAKAHALLNGRDVVSPADIRRVALPVLRHRVLTNYAAQAEAVDVASIVETVLREVPEPRSGIAP
ncbi:MAG: AAA family ATPase, partial [Gemmatimonadetes bacterium]|nr:AAA family ATPase [Gemmatimonadota bacterium]